MSSTSSLSLATPLAGPVGPAAEALPTRIGPYRIVRRIGQGGFAEVFLARDPETGAPLALKVLRDDIDPRVSDQVRGRFLAEEKISNAIAHPAIVKIRERSASGARPCFLVMEYVEGLPFCDYFRRQAAQKAGLGSAREIDARCAEVARLGHQVACAMHAAHERGIVHRDLKPENVLVAKSLNGHPTARIVDFGIAKAPIGLFSLDTAKTFTRYWTELGTVMGSPPYMAPEQNGAAHSVSGKADVFALGVMLLITLLELDPSELEGAAPLPPHALEALLEGSALPPGFAELLKSLLAVEPEVRPDMHEVALTLQRLAQPNREFALAVEAWLRKGRLPTASALLAWSCWAEDVAELTRDEQRFLKQAPALKLKSFRRRAAFGLALGILTSCTALVGGGLLLQRRASSELESRSRELQARRNVAPAQHDLAAVALRPTALAADPGPQKAALEAQLRSSQSQLDKQTRLSEERAGALQSLKGQLSQREKQQAQADGRAARLETQLAELQSGIAACRKDADQDLQNLALCRRELESQTQQLAENTDRLRLCSRSLRRTRGADAPEGPSSEPTPEAL